MKPKDDALREMLKQHEGLSLFPYRCPAGALTIGYGHNIDENGISIQAAELILDDDIDVARRVVTGMLGKDGWKAKLSQNRVNVLVDMAFNLGAAKLPRFKNMISAMQIGNWDTAANEMLDSKWAQQVGRRAINLARMMREG